MKRILIFFALSFLFLSCAQQQTVHECVTGTQYGFFSGLWHGWIIPLSFIGSLISDNISVWGLNNNGNWYVFGFVLGSGGVGTTIKWLILLIFKS